MRVFDENGNEDLKRELKVQCVDNIKDIVTTKRISKEN